MMKRKVVPGKGEEEIILFLWQEGFENMDGGKVFMNGEQGHSCHRGYCSIILKSTLKAH